ncbi:MAG TPA: HAMP domain-containing methyl-accepting chemotaxis protein, partial [Bacillota bacterium]
IFNRIINPPKKLLAKLKVWHQILLIISIMIVFLLLEGFLSLNTMEQMQAITEQVFNESVQGHQIIDRVREELDRIERSYFSILTNTRSRKTLNVKNLISLAHRLSSLEGKLQEASSLQNIQISAKKIENLVSQPIDLTNYQTINQVISAIRFDLSLIENQITSTVVKTMSSGKQFTKRSHNTIIMLLIISLIVSLIIGLLSAALIVNPLKAMVHTAGLLAQGDLTATITATGSREINQLVYVINNAITHLKNLVTNIIEQSETLNIASKELKEASAESGRAASEIARAMEEMAKAATEQTEQINTSSNNVTELAQLVRQVSKDTQIIANASNHVVTSAKNGQQITMDVAVNIDDLYETTKSTASVIDAMYQSSERIQEFASIIGGIAEQTTLLALNAAIEAARAGEHGRGFSVVAIETRKLAEQSKQASKMIEQLITEIIGRSSHAVTAIKKSVEKVEASKNLSTKAATTFENIYKELEDTLNQIHNVAQSATQMAQRNEQVINAVATVSALNEENMASTEEISATIQEQSTSAEEVATLADNLNSIADSMRQAVAQLKI